MKFDFVIGNPPYQGDNHQQLYPDFYLQARKCANQACMIFPTGWQEPKTANGLGKLNKEDIKHDKQIVIIDNRQNVFPDVGGAEWTNIVLWKRFYDNGLDGKQRILTDGENPQDIRLLINKSDKEKPEEIMEMARIVSGFFGFKSMQTITSVLKPYGLRTDVIRDPRKYGLPEIFDKKMNDDDMVLYGDRRNKYYIAKDYPLPRTSVAFDKYKVLYTYAWGGMDGKYLGGSYSDIIIAEPFEICTETYQEQGAYSTKDEARKHAKYILTRFARALLYMNKHSRHSTTAWGAVPVQSFTEPWWDQSIADIDRRLMEKYNIPSSIQKFVFENIQERGENNIINL